MTVQLPAWLQAGSYNAEIDRFVGTGLLNPATALTGRGGVRRVVGTEFQVTASLPASMQVQVAPGMAFVQGGYSATQGVYTVVNDATFSVTISAASSTNPRIDLVVLEVLDQAYAGSSNLAQVRVVTGVASSSPVPPSVTGSYIVLAQILVPTSASTISSTNVVDVRPFGGGLNTPVPVRTITERNALTNKYDGLRVFMMDNAWEINTYVDGQWYGSAPRVYGINTYSTYVGIADTTPRTVIDRAKVPDPGYRYMIHFDLDMEVSDSRADGFVYSEPTTTTSFSTLVANGATLSRDSLGTTTPWNRLQINRTFPSIYTGNRWITLRLMRFSEPSPTGWQNTTYLWYCQFTIVPVLPKSFTTSASTGGQP